MSTPVRFGRTFPGKTALAEKLENMTDEQAANLVKLLEKLSIVSNSVKVGGNLEVDGEAKFNNASCLLLCYPFTICKYLQWPEDYTGMALEIDEGMGVYLLHITNGIEDEDYVTFGEGGIIEITDSSKLQDLDGNPILKDLEYIINGENTVELTFTEDDWDEDEGTYVKRVGVNNTFIKVNFLALSEHEKYYKIYSPYFKATIYDDFDGFVGITGEPEDRYLALNGIEGTHYFSVFNGIVSKVSAEY